jgi:asparagine synthase (glutamine-hydrolysing)
MIHDLLLSPTFQSRGYFRPEAVATMVREHVQGRADFWQPLWALLVLEIWHREFSPSEAA